MNTTDNTRLDELLRQYRYLSIADLEATCTEHGSIEFNELETIGIGALMVCTKQLLAIDEFECLVRPVQHP